MATFKERFKELRKNRGLSQRELAIALHMSNSAIAMYETGKRQPASRTHPRKMPILSAIRGFFHALKSGNVASL